MKEMKREKIAILLIDDDARQAEEMKRFLVRQEEVRRVDCACCVREAAEYCALEAYDIAVLDLIMPGEDGFSFLEHTAGQKAPGSIVVSAVSSEDVIRKAFSKGAKYYMVKPFQKEILYRRIWDVLRLCSGEEAQAEAAGGAGMEQRITELFLRMGVPPHLKGYQYLKEAVKLTLADRMIIYSITKELYPKIAAAFGVTTTKVELAIRHTVEVMYDRDGMRRMKEALGLPADAHSQKPTNGELIALIAAWILSGTNE